MFNTTLCYIEKDGAYLMIHRVKKKNDMNKDKWVGVGGKLEEGESPFDCARREIKEETGVDVRDLNYRGIITFVSDLYGTEYMHLFTADRFDGELVTECNEGELAWIPKDQVFDLPLWEGDKVFLKLLAEEIPYFYLKLEYRGDTLLCATLDGRVIQEG